MNHGGRKDPIPFKGPCTLGPFRGFTNMYASYMIRVLTITFESPDDHDQ